jgi:hypothetical protein
MEASAGLVAGSHNRNELVVIRRDGEPGVRPRTLGFRVSVRRLSVPPPPESAAEVSVTVCVCRRR